MIALLPILLAACHADRSIDNPPAPPAAAPVEAPKPEPKPDEGLALPVWRALLADGCKVGASGPIWTPIEARVLEVTPLAERGWDFEEPELRAYFTKDGNWYAPVTGRRDLVLSGGEQACVERVRARREQLARSRPVADEFIALLLETPRVTREFWKYALNVEDPYRDLRVSQSGSEWALRAELPCTKEDFECHILDIRCDPVEPNLLGACWGGSELRE